MCMKKASDEVKVAETASSSPDAVHNVCSTESCNPTDALGPIKFIQCLLEKQCSPQEISEHRIKNNCREDINHNAAMIQLKDAEGKFKDTMASFKNEIPRLTCDDEILSYVKEHVKPAAYALMKVLAKLVFSKETIDIFIRNRRFAAYFQLVLNHFHAILLEGNMYEDVVITAEFCQDGEMKNGAFHAYTGLLTKMKPLFHLAGSPFCNNDYEIQHQEMDVSSLKTYLKEKQIQSNKVFQSLSKQVYPIPSGEEASLASWYRKVVTFFENGNFNPLMSSSANPLGTQVFESIFEEMSIQVKLLIAKTQEKEPQNDDTWFLNLLVKALHDIQIILDRECPYVDSLDLMEFIVTMFDINVRAERVAAEPAESNLRFHHTEWWLYGLPHLQFVAPKEGFFVIPTTANIGTTDLIKWKALPFGIIQIPFDILYVDRYFQTPMEFFVHDYQHARRHWWETYLNIYATQFNVTRDIEFGPPSFHFEPSGNALHFSRSDWLKRVEDRVREETTPIMAGLMKMIKVQDFKSQELQHLNVSNLPSDAQEDERNMRRLVKFLIFEIHHEENEPYAQAKMQDVLMREPGGQIDFIYQQVLSEPCGETTYPMRINYGHKKPTGATALAIGYRKLNTNFYSHFTGEELENFYPPREFVTTHNVARAAARLYDEVVGHADRWSVTGKDYKTCEELVKIFEAKTENDKGATTNQLKEWAAFRKKYDGSAGRWKSTMRDMDPEEDYISAEEQFQRQKLHENEISQSVKMYDEVRYQPPVCRRQKSWGGC
eukprot:gnl/MRDRNA2_/MRDRNA2_36047_c0_seq1.p1 gnl/MRDRNA2_/MRDRNA2_36047_c0~~gnl/MRDRNA2_/MRDRNA2_36047_c0_seq1.p1  ORF type:complete len:773 (+),score=116.44 gnl/MRDRNA2_/MRDRNA2_36047_c0_seq1:72-2390(+)